MGNGGILDCLIKLGFENMVVEHDLAALGIILQTNMAIVGLGRVGLSLGMVGALLSGSEFVVGENKC